MIYLNILDENEDTENVAEEVNCPMRENIQGCNIYLCRVMKNILSIGFPCYISQM